MSHYDKPLISVIVPVYKVEPYLQRCVDSILNQTYTNLEIILVDDGSPDNCGEICDEYASTDSRIVVIHKENGGLSSARNAGMDIAKGEYIGFVDSDDYISEYMFERLYCLVSEHDTKISECSKRIPGRIRKDNLTIKVMNRVDALIWMLSSGKYNVWCRLYHKSITSDLRFPLGLIYEDVEFTYKALSGIDSMVVTNECLYVYDVRENSITTTPYSMKNLDGVKASSGLYEFIKQNFTNKTLLKLSEINFIKTCYFHYYNLLNHRVIDREGEMKRMLKGHLINHRLNLSLYQYFVVVMPLWLIKSLFWLRSYDKKLRVLVPTKVRKGV